MSTLCPKATPRRHLRLTAVFTILWVLTVGTAIAGAEQSKDLFTLPLGSAVKVLADGEKAVARVPVKLRAGLSIDDLDVRQLDVRLDNFSDELLQKAFSDVELVSGSEKLSPAFQVNVDLGVGLQAGTYKVTLEVALKENTDECLLTTLDVIVPPAELRTGKKLVVHRINGAPVSPGPEKLVLHEDSGDSKITGLRVVQMSLADSDGTPVDTAVFRLQEQGPLEIPANDGEEFPFALEGDLPLGEVNGELEIRAPQLAQPEKLALTIHNRRSYGWIFGMIFFGVLAGYFSGSYLQANAEELKVVRKGAGDLVGIVEARPTSGTTAAEAALASDLRETAEGRDSKKIRKKIDELQVASGESVVDLPGKPPIVLEQARIKFLRMLVSLAMIAAVGLYVFEDGFVGTWQDLWKIFFWGFGLDLSFDKILDLQDQVK